MTHKEECIISLWLCIVCLLGFVGGYYTSEYSKPIDNRTGSEIIEEIGIPQEPTMEK